VPKVSLRTELLLNLGVVAAAVLMPSLVLAVLGLANWPERAFTVVLAVVVLDLIVLSAFTAFLVNRHVLRPLRQLVESTGAVAEGDLLQRAPAGPSIEFDTLADSVNRMTDHLLDVQGQLIRAEKLVSVGRLAAGIAHEVGNPLGALSTYVDVLRRRGTDEEVVAGLRREIDRIDRIVRSLLEYARPHDEAVGRVALNEVAQNAFQLLNAQGVLQKVAAQVDLDPQTPAILGRAHAIEQVVVNLMLNAVDAAPGQPVVLGTRYWLFDPQSRPVRRQSDSSGAYSRPSGRRPWRRELKVGTPGALLFVADGGPGVENEDRDRIFEPFYTTKGPGRGTGLGLAIVARTVHDLGGVVWVEKAREGGAAFKLFFPHA
jgi:signal transduction histidine kinase